MQTIGLWVLAMLATKMFKLVPPDVFERYALALSPSDVMRGWVWQVASYAWLHDLTGFSHIIMNSIGLLLLGPELERRWGGRTFLKYFVLTGLLAGVFSVLVGLVAPPLYTVSIVGASGAIFGLAAAWSLIFPSREILVLFFFPMRVKWLIWIAIALDFIVFAMQGHTDTAIQTHIGGAIAGWFLITGNWRPRVFWTRLKGRFKRRPASRRTYLNRAATSALGYSTSMTTD